MSDRIRLMLVDDQALFREGIKALLELEEQLDIVAEVGNGREALNAIEYSRPNVILMDLDMPVMNGIAAIKEIKQVDQSIQILALTTFDEDERIFDALNAGASGYVLKDTPSSRLVEAIKTIHSGESFLQPSIASKVVAELSRLSNPSKPRAKPLIEPLSSREEEVLRWLAQGMSNKEIAAQLDLAEGTVKNHISNILGKMGALDRTQAALKARELGFL
ncbi:response regulator transcription factor [Puniceicoccaceae bacterium K14]|nr:response regulator transcription factor [Puniceicoccaceae bacterium K14]